MIEIAYVVATIMLFWLGWESADDDRRAAMLTAQPSYAESPLVKFLVASLMATVPLAAAAALWYGWKGARALLGY